MQSKQIQFITWTSSHLKLCDNLEKNFKESLAGQENKITKSSKQKHDFAQQDNFKLDAKKEGCCFATIKS